MYIFVYIDNVDDGIGLPVQLPPTDNERAKICRCKPHPAPSPTLSPIPSPSIQPPSQITVSFKEMSYSADESDSNITFNIQISQASSNSISVEFGTQNSNPISAKGKVE